MLNLLQHLISNQLNLKTRLRQAQPESSGSYIELNLRP